MAMLPAWASVAWAFVFALLLIWHGARALRSRGAARVWHAGHVLMAATMVAMYAPLPADAALSGSVTWPVPVAVAAALLALGLAGRRGPRGLRAALWALTAVDVGAMVAMAGPAGAELLAGSALAAVMVTAMTVMAWLTPARPAVRAAAA